ncbi:MAG: efflux RND transporter permease subunit [Pirellulales bacterium]
MVHRLIHWAVNNKLVVILLACAIAAVGGYSLVHINIEAYPDPAPAIVEVIAQYPGASAEEVERQITVPMEVALAGMPGLTATRSKSLFGLAHVRNQFEYGIDPNRAKTEVINRLGTLTFPAGVTPQLNPASPIGEIYRYYIAGPKDPDGKPIYTTADLKSLQDWVLDREFRRIPRIASVVSFGGEVKRYEVQPDPERLHKYGIPLGTLEDSLQNSNGNAGGDYLMLGETVQAVRGLGLIGGGQDPVNKVLGLDDPLQAGEILRDAEERDYAPYGKSCSRRTTIFPCASATSSTAAGPKPIWNWPTRVSSSGGPREWGASPSPPPSAMRTANSCSTPTAIASGRPTTTSSKESRCSAKESNRSLPCTT